MDAIREDPSILNPVDEVLQSGHNLERLVNEFTADIDITRRPPPSPDEAIQVAPQYSNVISRLDDAIHTANRLVALVHEAAHASPAPVPPVEPLPLPPLQLPPLALHLRLIPFQSCPINSSQEMKQDLSKCRI
jgi:hypothetical protein